jgi:hypothetical protein
MRHGDVQIDNIKKAWGISKNDFDNSDEADGSTICRVRRLCNVPKRQRPEGGQLTLAPRSILSPPLPPAG